eukprot:g66356.t1
MRIPSDCCNLTFLTFLILLPRGIRRKVYRIRASFSHLVYNSTIRLHDKKGVNMMGLSKEEKQSVYSRSNECVEVLKYTLTGHETLRELKELKKEKKNDNRSRLL